MIFSNLHRCFVCNYGGKDLNPPVSEISPDTDFDLTDKSEISAIADVSRGEAAFQNSSNRNYTIIHIDSFLRQLGGRNFMKGNSRVCDYMLVSDHNTKNSVIVFAELTTADSIENLEKPILDKKTRNVIFARGKSEKGPTQLAATLKTLSNITCIADEFKKFNRRFCVFFYRINSNLTKFSSVKAFSRGASAISTATSTTGAKLSYPEINNLGFDFYRVEYPTQFRI
ncbi:MAG: hypothetical protein K2G53_02160 [Muribaculaceae bacterium]|nr:hypothetical protein [Muribaculaceae bacterium]